MAVRYFVSGGVDNNWGSTSNWSLTSGGAGGQTVPATTDDVFFDANSPNCTVNALARVALSLDFTGYTSTLTTTFGITVSSPGTVTLSATMTISGTGTLLIGNGSTGTLTSNGKAWPGPLQMGSGTLSLADDWTVGSFLAGTSSNNLTLNGGKLIVLGNFSTNTVTTGSILGTSEIVLAGSGAVISTLTTGRITNLTFSASGTYTLPTTLRMAGGLLKYTSGTVTTAGTTLLLAGTSGFTTDVNTGSLVWGDVSFGLSGTVNITGTLYVSGVLQLSTAATSVLIINGGSIVHSGGTISSSISTGTVTGSTVLNITNNCTVGSASMTSGRITLPHVVDAAGKTVTINNTWNTDISHWKRVAGTITGSDGDLSSELIYRHPGMNGGFRA